MRKIGQTFIIVLIGLLVSGNFVYAAQVGAYVRLGAGAGAATAQPVNQSILAKADNFSQLAVSEWVVLNFSVFKSGGQFNFFDNQLQLALSTGALSAPSGVKLTKTASAAN